MANLQIEKSFPAAAFPVENLKSDLPSQQSLPFLSSILEKQASLTELPIPTSKPQLDSPISSGWKMIESILELEKITDALLELNDARTHHYFAKMQELEQEHALKMKEAAERTQTSNFWNFLKEIGSLVLAAISTVLGISLIATGAAPIVGGAMIVSGVLAITNKILSDTGSWTWIAKSFSGENEELRKQLEAFLPAAVGIVSTVIGLAGSVGAFFFASLDFTQKSLTIVQTAATFIEGVTSIGNGVAQARSQWTQADLGYLNAKTTHLRFRIEEMMQQMQELFDQQMQIHEQASTLVDLTKNSIQVIHQII